MRDAIEDVMKSITLCDMVNDYYENNNINRLENDIYCLMNNEIKKQGDDYYGKKKIIYGLFSNYTS